MPLSRRLALLLPLAAAGCGDGPPLRTTFPPLRSDYLTPLALSVASIDYVGPPTPNPLDEIDPVPPGPALLQLARDRLSAAGSSGRALVTVSDATVARGGNTLAGSMGLRVEVFDGGANRVGFAEAQVTRRVAGIGPDLRGALYDLTKQMLDDMNVELEFQLRQNLRGYLQVPQTAPAPAPVQQQDLDAPPS